MEFLQHPKPKNTSSTSLVRKILLNDGLQARAALRKPFLARRHGHFRNKNSHRNSSRNRQIWGKRLISEKTMIE